MKRFGLFCCHSLSFALPLEQLDKIVQGVPLFRLPRLQPCIAAVLVDNEEIVPVLHPDCLGSTCSSEGHGAYPYYVLVLSDSGRFALPASQVHRIVSEVRGRYEPCPDNEDPGITGMFTQGDRRFDILNIEYLVLAMTQGFRRSSSETDAARRHQ